MRGDGKPGAPGTDSGVHHGQVNRAGGEPRPGPAQQIGTGSHVARRHRVGHIHQGEPRSRAQERALHFGDVGVAGSEIGEESDEAQRGSASENRQGDGATRGLALKLVGHRLKLRRRGAPRFGHEDRLTRVGQLGQARLKRHAAEQLNP